MRTPEAAACRPTQSPHPTPGNAQPADAPNVASVPRFLTTTPPTATPVRTTAPAPATTPRPAARVVRPAPREMLRQVPFGFLPVQHRVPSRSNSLTGSVGYT